MPTIYLQFEESILDIGNSPPVAGDILDRAALTALSMGSGNQPQDQETELTLVVTDDSAIQALNKQYLGVDAPTDVLSFPAEEMDPDSQALYLGDVVLSYPRAEVQAAAGGHTVAAELELLVVHGVLHLLGFDHTEESEKDKMWAIQDEILAAIGCPARPTE
jgi:probable rRNA maturation factor